MNTSTLINFPKMPARYIRYGNPLKTEKVDALKGTTLAWAVGVVEDLYMRTGQIEPHPNDDKVKFEVAYRVKNPIEDVEYWKTYQPQKDYLFVRNVIVLTRMAVKPRREDGRWEASTATHGKTTTATGDTLEEAVLRCYVKQDPAYGGDEVEVPDELFW